MRDGKERNFTVTLANMHGTESIVKGGDSFYNEKLGLMLEPLSQEQKNTIKKNFGLRVVEVKDGVFKRQGLNKNYIILTVNNQKVSNEKELNTALSNGRNGKIRVEMTDSAGEFLTILEFYDR
jgi:S1-C subfamily serine protease